MKSYADARLGEQRCRSRTTRSRRARSAASSSRPRRTRWSCTSHLERLTSKRHRTKTEAPLRPPSTSMPRSCRTDRGGHWAESDVEETSARRKRSAESGSRAMDGAATSAMDKDLPFSRCEACTTTAHATGSQGHYHTRRTISFIMRGWLIVKHLIVTIKCARLIVALLGLL